MLNCFSCILPDRIKQAKICTNKEKGGETMVGKNLKKLRLQNKLSQTETAKLLGTSQTLYSAYERDQYEPNNKNLVKMAEIFNTSTDYLLGRYDKKA